MKYLKTPFIKGMIMLPLVLIANYCYPQLVILDHETGEPIPFVNILSASRQVLDISDISGKVDVKNMTGANLQGTKKIIFSHMSYEELEIEINTLALLKELRLKGRVYGLQEIVVNNSKSKMAYLVLNGFFRSYIMEDSIPKYYSDGIVEYYIPLDKQKEKPRLAAYNVIEYRNLYNSQFELNRKMRNINFVVTAPGVPNVYRTSTIKYLANEFDVKQTGLDYTITKDHEVLGRLEIDTLANKGRLYANLFSSVDKNTVKELFNHEIKFVIHTISESYTFPPGQSGSAPDYIDSKRMYHKILIKHKKDGRYFPEDTNYEFYVTERAYISAKDFNNIKVKTFNDVKGQTYYTYKYWEDFPKYNISKLPQQIEKVLKQEFR